MSDRELLELAAKATGLRIVDWAGMVPMVLPPGRTIPMEWQPLTDDGDAFRLAVRLQISTEPLYSYCVAYSGGVCAQQFSEPVRNFDDPFVAARRAVVRAAAEIGKAMP